jgi:hypothetical protein
VGEHIHVDATEEIYEVRVRGLRQVGVIPETVKSQRAAMADRRVAELSGAADGIEAEDLVDEELEGRRVGWRANRREPGTTDELCAPSVGGPK